MLYGLRETRDNIRNREGSRVFYLGKGDQLTSEARDFLQAERIPILPAETARPKEYVLLTGGSCAEKPEHMTHLHGNVLVPKTHPRIRFRGAMDTLEGELLQAVSLCREEERRQLLEILTFTRDLIRWEVLDQPVPSGRLLGLTQEELRDHSHFPQKYYHQPHFMPTGLESAGLLQVNMARCAARNAEIMAEIAFRDGEKLPLRQDLLRAMNRLSSAIYIVMIRMKAKEENHGS